MDRAVLAHLPAVALALGFGSAVLPAAEGGARVELEVVAEPGAPIVGPQRWLDTLKDVGFDNLRIRTAAAGDQAGVQTTGSGATAVHRVTGVITRQNTLVLPGGTFTLGDRARITQWLARLRDSGEEGVTTKPAAFGLTGRQLIEVHEKLAVRVRGATKGKRAGDVARDVVAGLPYEVTVDPSAAALRGADLVSDELGGVASGTALAAVLRPLGLVLVPNKPSGGEIRLLITDARAAEEAWPVGWPAERPVRDLVPKFFEFLEVEIKNVPLTQAVEAIQGRLGVPFVYDQNSLARQRIEPAEVAVTLPTGRTYYKQALDRLLSQARMKGEVRIDEAGQPLVWLTSIKP
jgi:hypothetical protein